eukprot:TRINITY_DN3513_c0_g1_i2.p1 TRINITY_DN3513_c0_g1~~TRINITY_DN3513_c0_g1_i2.p1  ORF type:complete len:432 (+),score=56.42 TRINITY_DN3513_c0_g1_i2:73-1368(+)
MYLEIGLAFFLILIVGYYFKVTRGYGSFEAKGYPEDKGYFPFGSQMFWDMFTRKSSFRDYPDKYREQFPGHKFYIAWSFGNPVVVVKDAELARSVLVKDFEVFPNRRPLADMKSEDNKYFANMMSVISDVEKWRKVRTMISPVFTSGKLKAMTPILQESADQMLEFSSKIDRDMVDGRNFLTRFTTQSIAKAGFGVEADCYNTDVEEPVFMSMVNSITSRKGSKWRQLLFFLFFLILPDCIAKYLPISLLDPASQRFFLSMVNQSIENRKKTKVSRGDFVDLLLQELYKNNAEESNEKEASNEDATQYDKDAKMKVSDLKKFNEDELETILRANVFVLLFAGFETTSSMLSAMLLYLANYPQIQEKIYQEVSDAVRDNNEEKLDYQSIMNLKYLDSFIFECLRIFPFLTLERFSSKPYVIPGTDLKMDKGT